ncbi:terminase large subunit [Paenibacillus albiflavus]|uniref:Terminase large subunit n=1 Tax=Paenibacillus albiflavus TaxID=2545760 RepID=A0A4R4E9C8_9BACL|nr:terminase TerL endonuclease subunit [Paenibacillus albiflavus]TCZ76169.1 terminase large subunit [Paenibacillus albiflavus]
MLKQYIIDYSRDVINGEIVACQKHKWACMRFLRDVERENTDEFPYIFDEDKALRFLEWMTLFRHTKGILKGEKINPHEIQVFIFGNIYGWVHRSTSYRRFKYGYWQVGRKNAKSQSLACVGSYETAAMDEGMAEVYCAATKKDQAKIVWNEIDVMIKRCPELKDKFKTSYGVITHKNSQSIIKPLSKEDGKKGDGYNPQCGIVDEYHAHETTEMYDVIDSGMMARVQPLMMIITTAGEKLNNPCYRVEYEMVSKLLDPNNPIENDEYFAMVNELDKDEDGNVIDDIMDESVWEKANPIVCSYPAGRDNIRKRLKNAINAPEKMNDFLTKNLNVWVNGGANKYMRMDRWALCAVNPENLPELRGKECYVGIDLSSKIDLTSVSFVFPLEDGRVSVFSHSFMPEETLETKKRTDKVPYDLWEQQGWITKTPGAVVDYRFIEEYVQRMIDENGWVVKQICYDPYNATQFAQNMETKGFVMVEIRQGMKTLSEPTKNFREMVLEKKVIHDKNPVLAFALGNAVTEKDQNDNIMLSKKKSTQRIDPAAATINAHVQAMFDAVAADLNKHIMSEDFGF